jgi:hexosaminidase
MNQTATRCAGRFMLAALLVAGSHPVARAAAMPSDAIGFIPLPRSVQISGGSYALPSMVTIRASSAAERNVADFARQFLATRGIAATIDPAASAAQFRLDANAHDAHLGSEGYRLEVSGGGVRILANAGAGLFYGLQTLEQLFLAGSSNAIPNANIVDRPEYGWRGISLDVGRHFFPVDVVEKYIDVAAHYKLNIFHWHLTDDQGWRIEIKRYPRLAQIAACRDASQIGADRTMFDGRRYCGYYTQDQIRDVVAFAKQRYVTIVPEIEMPGHSAAVLAAYPELACRPGEHHVRETWGISADIVCPSEAAFTFYDNVLSEVVDLFPGPYVHVGGDEVPKKAWAGSRVVAQLMAREQLSSLTAVQNYFDRRIERFLAAKGRRTVGWDNILAGVSSRAIITSFRGARGAIRAAQAGNDVVMTPDGPLYFDAYQSFSNDEPLAIGGPASTLQDVYEYYPTPGDLTAFAARHVIGAEGSMWTEYIPTPEHLFYMLLPRELALSEIAWDSPRIKNWESFLRRTSPQYAWFDANGYTYRIPEPTFWAHDGVLEIHDLVPDAQIVYTTDGSRPNERSKRYVAPLHLSVTKLPVFAAAITPSGRMSLIAKSRS